MHETQMMLYLFDSYDRVYFEGIRPYVTKPPAPSSKARDIQERSFEDLHALGDRGRSPT